MEKKDYETIEMLAYEAFIRRASKINFPFMLKGSYVTRQYFQNPNDRIPADLDWVYLEKLNDEQTTKEKLNEWVTLVTEVSLDDNVTFRSFQDNVFWRRIDYAMDDDFPTVNTDILCWVGEEELEFGLDVSFNLDIQHSPVPLSYKPLSGAEFIFEKTVPMSLQVSWKIHQTLVRPRFKDLFDLIHLVKHDSFDNETLKLSIQVLLDECKADNVNLDRLKYFLNYDLDKLFPNNTIQETWEYWRHNINKKNYGGNIPYFDKAEHITNVDNLPKELSLFLSEFKKTMEINDWIIDIYDNLEIEEIEEVKQKTKIIEPTLTKEKRKEMSLWDKIKRFFK